jgi:hypothetical protein
MQDLINEYDAWLNAYSYPAMSADELLFAAPHLLMPQDHVAWLLDFIQRWDAAQDAWDAANRA